MVQISFRRPGASDLETVAAIYNHAVRETAATFDTEQKAPEYFRPFIAGDDLRRMLVAETDGAVIAYGGTYPFSQRKAYSQLAELMIYVHPDWHRHGVGSALLGEIHSKDFLKGLHSVLALINKENIYVHLMFEKLGYAYKGEMTEVAFKLGRRHSLVLYQYHPGGQNIMPA